MALSKTAVQVLPSQATTALGSTKASPNIVGTSINTSTYYGGELTWKISNPGTAPGVALSLTFQVSHDGTSWYDYYTTGGDTIASSVNSNSIVLDRGVMYLRAIAYGNTGQQVTVEAWLQAVTSL